MDNKQPKARVLAYYLPQFHPIPENDRWWGKGFTEWTNVGKAKPLFPGHYQPRVPADLGYYDLRIPEVREAQAQMAREAGIEGFVYWHYWFGNGKRMLEMPFNEVLASGKPDFPFALAWANDSWGNSFHGQVKGGGVLLEQTYPGDEDYIAHFKFAIKAFKDERYIKYDGKPIFIIYKPKQVPDMAHFIQLWRKLAEEAGLPGIYFIGIANILYDHLDTKETFGIYKKMGFDGMNVINMYESGSSFWYKVKKHVWMKWLRKPDIRPYDISLMKGDMDGSPNIFPTIYPNWDHTPRTGYRGVCVVGSTPEKWKQAVSMMLERIQGKPYEENFLFIKSWNEWAEGNYLEPDMRYGKQYLDALKECLYN